MKPSNVRTGLMLFIILCTTPCAGQSLSKADRPEVKVGDAWAYQDRDARTGEKRELSFLVTLVDSDKIVTETGMSTSGAWTFTREWNLVQRKTGDTVAMSTKPQWPYFQFPLEVGKSWEAAFENEVAVRTGIRYAKWQWKARVEAAETVTVPAGTFQTLKVVYDGTYASREGNRAWSGSQKDTMWYAPAVKRFVKHEYEQSAPANNYLDHRVSELLSFTPAP